MPILTTTSAAIDTYPTIQLFGGTATIADSVVATTRAKGTTIMSYDVLVIGAGPAGENAADVARQAGKTVAVVERELVGGECSYWACMPSKALLRPGEALRMVQRVPGAREAVTGELDIAAVLRRRDAFTSGFDDAGQVDWLASVDVDLIRGHATITAPRTIEVTDSVGLATTHVANDAVVIATGTSAAVPPIDGLRNIRIWDNREATTTSDVPRRLIVLGGGVVGSEMAQAWKDLGATEVTIIEMLPRLLAREEPFVGDELKEAFEERGINVLVDSKAVKVDRARDDAPVTVWLEDGTEIEGDEILVAVGRRPNTANLGLESVGISPGSYLTVDKYMRVTDVDGGWLYAVGDVNGRALLTHTGKYQARIAGAHIAGIDSHAWADQAATPRVVFTDPTVAAVGHTETTAVEAGINVRTVQYGTGWSAGAATLGQGIGGTSQLVIDADREVIVGATFVGPGVGEMLHAATIAIVGEVTLDTLWHAIPAFPTVSEIWLRFLEAYRDEHSKVFV